MLCAVEDVKLYTINVVYTLVHELLSSSLDPLLYIII